MVAARFECGIGRTLTIAIAMLFFLVAFVFFFWPAFSSWWLFWLQGYSHMSLLTHRSLGFVPIFPDIDKHPPPEVFLADGGHLENSGAFPLLIRKCSCIVAVCSNADRACSDLYTLMELSQRKLNCMWDVTEADSIITGGPMDHMLDFRLPRARYVGDGFEPAKDAAALLSRECRARDLMLGRLQFSQEGGSMLRWSLSALRHHTSHVRARDGHVYLYFVSDEALAKAFTGFAFIRQNFKICQAVDAMKGLEDDDFLDTEVMEAETLRHSTRLIVRYNDGLLCDFFFLRGEVSPAKQRQVREHLQPYEPCSLLWTTIGKFPGHSTLGEGYTYAHVNAYAEYAKTSMRHAWENGLRDLL